MNLILLHREDFVAAGTAAEGVREGSGHVRLLGRRRDHLEAIHRAAPGDEFCVGLLDDRVGRGRVTALTSDALEMSVVLDRDPPAPLPVTLVLALPRPPVLKRVLIAATSMGVKRIELLHCRRVEKSFWSSSALAESSVREQLLLGLEQARDTVLPRVGLHRRFRPFVEDELPDLAKDTVAVVADPGASALCPRDVRGRATLVVGPEGGFVPFELDRLAAAGLQPVRIGPRVLRVESAIPALLSRLF